MLQIQDKPAPKTFALFELGFRPFFAAAGLFAVVAIAVWMGVYLFGVPLLPGGVSPIHWHGHEMVYGYAMAVIAGFLLTAVVNWTGVMTVRHGPLAVLLLLWLCGRLLPYLVADGGLAIAALSDTLFLVGLIGALSIPVWRVRQWKQLGILGVLLLMMLTNLVFYAGALGYLGQGIRWGLYGGLYLVMALVFVMGRRVIPFFIERGVDETFSPRNRGWVDLSSLGLFLVWAVLDLFAAQDALVAVLSVLLVATHALRLRDWYTPGIWRKPLLWSLYLGYLFLLLGFLLKAASVWIGISPNLALHAFAYGGIGLVTIGMMARVALGHSGRNVFDPPRELVMILGMVLIGGIVRVLLPLFAPGYYPAWIGLSLVLWIVAFGAFAILYLPILVRPRLDGRPG